MGHSKRNKALGSKASMKMWNDLVGEIVAEARRDKVMAQIPRWPEGQKVAVGYSRVSTDEQKATGTSLEGQAKICEKYYREKLAEEGYVWKGVLNDESVSATKRALFDRPEGKMILTMRPGDAVIFPVFDRAFRTMRDFVMSVPVLQKLGIKVCLIDFPIDINTPEGQFMLAMRAATAEFESKMIARRMMAGKAIRKAQARPWGFHPNGFIVVGKTKNFKGRLKPDWEFRAFALAAMKLLNEGMSQRKVLQACNRKWCEMNHVTYVHSEFKVYPWKLINIKRLKRSIELITEVEGSEDWMKVCPKIKLV